MKMLLEPNRNMNAKNSFFFSYAQKNVLATSKIMKGIKTLIKKEQFYTKNRNTENVGNRDNDSFIDLCAESIYLFCCLSIMNMIRIN